VYFNRSIKKNKRAALFTPGRTAGKEIIEKHNYLLEGTNNKTILKLNK
jgi:hypothetical protein